MTFLKDGYIARKIGRQSISHPRRNMRYRDWYLVKYGTKNKSAPIDLGQIHVPSGLIGKKVKFKIEIIQDK